jgi:hypothetical protein
LNHYDVCTIRFASAEYKDPREFLAPEQRAQYDKAMTDGKEIQKTKSLSAECQGKIVESKHRSSSECAKREVIVTKAQGECAQTLRRKERLSQLRQEESEAKKELEYYQAATERWLAQQEEKKQQNAKKALRRQRTQAAFRGMAVQDEEEDISEDEQEIHSGNKQKRPAAGSKKRAAGSAPSAAARGKSSSKNKRRTGEHAASGRHGSSTGFSTSQPSRLAAPSGRPLARSRSDEDDFLDDDEPSRRAASAHSPKSSSSAPHTAQHRSTTSPRAEAVQLNRSSSSSGNASISALKLDFIEANAVGRSKFNAGRGPATSQEIPLHSSTSALPSHLSTEDEGTEDEPRLSMNAAAPDSQQGGVRPAPADPRRSRGDTLERQLSQLDASEFGMRSQPARLPTFSSLPPRFQSNHPGAMSMQQQSGVNAFHNMPMFQQP